MNKPTTVAIPQPNVAGVSADVVAFGPLIPKIERIKIFSPLEWEELILEWVHSLSADYEVERCGGAGDMGRDIIATHKEDRSYWDNYQCKHYGAPLMPSNIWVELGKLCYYTYRGDYTYPRKYCFVAPQGAGTTLSNLLKKPDDLRAGLMANWELHCRTKITSVTTVELDKALRDYIDGLNFAIFEAIQPLDVIDQHAKTSWHVARFGGGLPQRPPIATPPADPTEQEANYVRQLLDAYGDRLKRNIATVEDLASDAILKEHFSDSRRQFYSAESLRTFSRDTLPPGEFERLQGQIHDGIKVDLYEDHPDGYKRVLAVVKTAQALQLNDHALISRLQVLDRGGICHQLANENTVRWVK